MTKSCSSHEEEGKKDSITRNITFDPPYDITFDTSSILCFTKFHQNIVLITNDCTASAMGDNEYSEISVLLPKEHIKTLTRLDIKDENGKLWYPISAVCGLDYTLYMVSDVPNGFKKRLVYSARKLKTKFPLFLNIEKVNPIALFGGLCNSAAIDTEGAIIYIHQKYKKKPKKPITPKFLPGGEKTVSLACGEEELIALSSNGNIFISNVQNMKKLVFIQFVEISKIKFVQLSGINYHFLALSNEGKIYVYGFGPGLFGMGYDESNFVNFTENTSLSKEKIAAVYAGFRHSIYQTEEGKLFICLDCYNDKLREIIDKNICIGLYKPSETIIKSGACFCISEFDEISIFFGFTPKMSPNQTIKFETKIGLFGGNEKTKIAQIFYHNKYNDNDNNDDNNDNANNNIIDSDNDNANNINDSEYVINIEIDHIKSLIRLIDTSKLKDINDFNARYLLYQQIQYYLFFYDVSNFSSSLNELSLFYKELNNACNGDFKLAIVTYGGSLQKTNEIKRKFKCEVFEVNLKNMETVNKPFYYFIQSKKEIIKSNKEHNNPFLHFDHNNINIGLFGHKSKLAFRYIYGEFYEQFYLNYINNIFDVDLIKIIEVNNQVFSLAVLDSSLVTSIEKSYYSAVQGLIFVFDINICLSNNYIEKIMLEINEAKKAVEGELLFEIALFKNEKVVIENKKINEIKNEFKCGVFPFSLKTGENVNEMFYFLAKKITSQKNQNLENSQVNQKNQNQSKLLYPYCTEKFAGKDFIKQKYYRCYTCFPPEKNNPYTKCICEYCVKTCHKGHRIKFVGEDSVYCDCFLLKHCKCKPPLINLKCISKITNGFPNDLPLYQCMECEIDHICQNCAIKLHSGHKLILSQSVDSKGIPKGQCFYYKSSK